MPTYYDSKNQPYVLAERLGSGGEGTVYSCPGDAPTVAKIYHEPITGEKAEKLRWMAANKNEQLLKVSAWIVDTLHDAPGGKIVGFTMPHVRAKEIHELYSLKSRRVYFPEATWQFLVHTAANVARAFYALHKNEHIMGDVNHGNCVVLADGTVKLIDCDSYSIKIENRRYACEVGVATHLAPELQGANLSRIEREEKHDNFGLAVIIFQLLFLGRHPFAGNYTGGEDKSLEDCIRELRFAYAKDAHLRKVRQPPGTLALDAVSPRVATMFERAFLTEARPSPREWIEALEDLSENLQSCKMHPGHHFYSELDACPWCAIELQTGLMLFPFVSQTNRLSDGEKFNIFTVENLVASLDVSRNLPTVLQKTNVAVPPPSLAARETKKAIRERFILIITAQLAASVVFVAVFGKICIFIPCLIILLFCVAFFKNFAKTHKIDLEINLDSAKRNWEKLAKSWAKSRASVELRDNLAEIRKKIGVYQNLHKDSRFELKNFQDAYFQREANNYLASFRLSENHVSGIGEKRLAVLRSFGIKTAADIERQRLHSVFPGIGNATVRKLLDWRRDLEKDFQYQPNAELFKTVEEKVEHRCAETRRGVEREIGGLLVALRSSSARVRREQHELSSKAAAFSRELAQAERDMTALAFQAPAIGSMITAAFFVVFCGNIFYSLPAAPSYQTNTAETHNSGAASRIITAPPIPAPPKAQNDYAEYYVSETITDAEIKNLDVDYRLKAAINLYKQSLSLTDKDAAERKLRLAIKLDNRNSLILTQLGTVLYDLKKYRQSVEILNQSLAMSPRNIGTQIYVGMNYHMMEKYADARRVFSEVIAQDSSVQVAHYNLGLACKEMKDYPAAIEALRQAAVMSPADADSQYEIGVCLFKSGDRAGARRQYELLLNIDTQTAEKLRVAINLKV